MYIKTKPLKIKQKSLNSNHLTLKIFNTFLQKKKENYQPPSKRNIKRVDKNQ